MKARQKRRVTKRGGNVLLKHVENDDSRQNEDKREPKNGLHDSAEKFQKFPHVSHAAKTVADGH